MVPVVLPDRQWLNVEASLKEDVVRDVDHLELGIEELATRPA